LLFEIIGCTLGRQSPLIEGAIQQKHPSIGQVFQRQYKIEVSSGEVLLASPCQSL